MCYCSVLFTVLALKRMHAQVQTRHSLSLSLLMRVSLQDHKKKIIKKKTQQPGNQQELCWKNNVYQVCVTRYHQMSQNENSLKKWKSHSISSSAGWLSFWKSAEGQLSVRWSAEVFILSLRPPQRSRAFLKKSWAARLTQSRWRLSPYSFCNKRSETNYSVKQNMHNNNNICRAPALEKIN